MRKIGDGVTLTAGTLKPRMGWTSVLQTTVSLAVGTMLKVATCMRCAVSSKSITDGKRMLADHSENPLLTWFL